MWAICRITDFRPRTPGCTELLLHYAHPVTAATAADRILGADRSTALTVADLLAQSLAHHLQYRQAVSANETATIASELAAAARLRALAQITDVPHSDGAWQTRVSLHPNQSFTHEELHGDLLRYYAKELGLGDGA